MALCSSTCQVGEREWSAGSCGCCCYRRCLEAIPTNDSQSAPSGAHQPSTNPPHLPTKPIPHHRPLLSVPAQAHRRRHWRAWPHSPGHLPSRTGGPPDHGLPQHAQRVPRAAARRDGDADGAAHALPRLHAARPGRPGVCCTAAGEFGWFRLGCRCLGGLEGAWPCSPLLFLCTPPSPSRPSPSLLQPAPLHHQHCTRSLSGSPASPPSPSHSSTPASRPTSPGGGSARSSGSRSTLSRQTRAPAWQHRWSSRLTTTTTTTSRSSRSLPTSSSRRRPITGLHQQHQQHQQVHCPHPATA